ncbi:hypothetical protein EDB19DRAFT_1830335 [Suillus lakei]|nr:hypothetical protein EDB19DRAFT_1830335 [Suillus lakei]
MQARGKDPTDTKVAPAMKRPEVVEVYAARGFQRYVAMKQVRKTKSSAATSGVPPAAAHASTSSSQPGLSSQVVSVQAGPSSHAMAVNVAQSSQATGGPSSHAVAVNVGQFSQATGGPSPMSPSHFVTNYYTNYDSDSRSSIEGSCNRFLDRICFPFGHYHEDS